MGFLRDLLVRVKGDKTHLDSTLKGAEGSVNKFSGVVKKLAGVLAAAFGVHAIINFTKEVINLSAKMEGIKKGFDQIASPGLLDELRKATKGTVSDMQLMSRAVQASNFQIPLKDLAKLLEFASARAVQTGQSVDYLVDSIVLGIGRKSPLILDNLGISAVKLREKLKGVGTESASVGDIAGVVGQIATEELAKMGGMAVTTGVKLQQLGATWENLKSSIGKTITETKAFQTIIQWLADEAEIFGDDKLTFWQKMNGSPEDYKKWKKDQQEAQAIINENTNKLFPGLLDGLKKVEDQTKADAIASGQLAEKLKLEAEAMEKAAKAAKELADAKAKGGYSPTILPGRGIVSPKAQPRDKEAVSMAQSFFKGIAPGADELAGAPTTKLSQEDKNRIDSINAELRESMTEMEEILTAGRDMAIDMGAQIVEALGEAFAGGNVEDIGKGLLLSFANFLSQFGKMLLLAGLGIEAFVKSTATLNPALAIGAGIAMMIAAGAVKGLIGGAAKQVASGGSSGGGSGSSASLMNQKIVIEGRVKGRDIYWSNRRYQTELGRNT